MGHEQHIKKPEKLDSKFIPTYRNKEILLQEISETKSNIICHVMINEELSYSSAKEMANKVRHYALLIEDLAKHNIKEQFEDKSEDTIWFCGWEYSRDCDFEKDEIINRIVENLMILKYVVPTPDYFDENEKFFDKINHISEELNFDDIIFDIINHEFINFYKELDVTYTPSIDDFKEEE